MATKTFTCKSFEWNDELVEWVNENADHITVVTVTQKEHGMLPFRVWYWED